MTEPIVPEQLRRALTAAVPRRQPRPAQPAPAIDERQIDEIRNYVGADRLRDLLTLAQSEITERPKRIRQLAEQEHFARLRNEAHNFTGAVASLGLVGVARATRAVEQAPPGTKLALALDRLDRESLRGRMAVALLLSGLPVKAAVNG